MSSEKYPVRTESVDYTIPVSGEGPLIDLNGMTLVAIEVPVSNLDAGELLIMTNSRGDGNDLYPVAFYHESQMVNLPLLAAIAPNLKQVTLINPAYTRGLRYIAVYVDGGLPANRTIRLILSVL
jgi:hypothetical protein